MSEPRVWAELLGLPGVEVDLVEREAEGSFTVHVTSAADRPGCCSGCGQPAGRVKERTAQTLKHLVVVPMRVSWHKSRFWCENPECAKVSFAESGPVAAGRATVSVAAKTVMGHLVGEWLVPVSRVAAGAGVSWHTAHDAFVQVAADAQIVITGTRADKASGAGHGGPAGEGTQATADPGPRPARPCRSVSGVLPPVEVLGIDEHRRGKPLYHRDRATGAWVADADRWQTVFVDATGGHGLLGQVEGRTGVDATTWLAAQDPAWRAGISPVTIDMSSVYKSVVTTSGLLPQADLVVDGFHVIQLANKTIGDVRRRVTLTRYGRRGRAGDPEYRIKNLLVRGQEKLSDRARGRLLCTLADLHSAGRELSAAWRAKELLRALIRLSPNRTGITPCRGQVSAALERFFTFAATIAATVPEVQTLAQTISTWRAEIARGVLTGYSNAAAEGINRLIKLVYRGAFGFTNVPNQQRRSRYAASRSTRPEWVHTVTTTNSLSLSA